MWHVQPSKSPLSSYRFFKIFHLTNDFFQVEIHIVKILHLLKKFFFTGLPIRIKSGSLSLRLWIILLFFWPTVAVVLLVRLDVGGPEVCTTALTGPVGGSSAPATSPPGPACSSPPPAPVAAPATTPCCLSLLSNRQQGPWRRENDTETTDQFSWLYRV